uniref:hypothetical protein n=1 Tax=Pseudomonas proteolytica TaxID=219574 RepID=UPI0030DDA7AA
RAFAIVILPPLLAGASTNWPVTALRPSFLAPVLVLLLVDEEAVVAMFDMCSFVTGFATLKLS